VRSSNDRLAVSLAERGDDDPALLADQLQRRLQVRALGDAGGQDRGVGELAAGELGDDAPRLVHVRRDVRGAQLQRLLSLEPHRVDGDDVAAAGDPRTLDRVGTDPADTDDHGGVARAQLGAAHRGAEPGGHTAADEHSHVQREPLIDLHDRLHRHHRVPRERAEQAHLADVLAAGVEAVGAVELRAERGARAVVAQVRVAAHAVAAPPAGRQERHHHRIAHLDLGDARADLDDPAGALVPADHRVGDGQIAGHEVLVGVAEPARGQLHQHLTGRGWVELDLLDLPLPAQLPEHRRRGLHAHSMAWCALRHSGPVVPPMAHRCHADRPGDRRHRCRCTSSPNR
jgi:hypothetical protein